MRRFFTSVLGLLAVALIPDAGHGAITEIIDLTGDGAGNALNEPRAITVDAAGNAYMAGLGSDNAFEISGVAAVVGGAVPALSSRGSTLLGLSLVCAAWWLARRPRIANA